MPTDPFVKPASDVHSLHANIVDALGELRGARKIHEHSPTVENEHMVDLCEWRLDVLLLRQKATSEAEAAAEKLVTQ